MAVGTYEIQNASGYVDYSGSRSPATGSYRHIAERITMGQSVVLRSVFVYYAGEYGGSTAPLHQLRIYRVSDAVQIYNENLWLSTTQGWQEKALSSPVLLESGVQYSIGFEVPVGYNSNIAYDATGSASDLIGVSTPTGINSSWYGYLYYTNLENAFPNTAVSDSLLIKLSVDLPSLPNTPTGLTSTNSPVPIGGSATATWTHNDPINLPQTKYQFRWRKVDE